MDRKYESMQSDSLQGNMVSRVTKKVLAFIKDLTLDTDSEIWIKGK